MSKINFYKLDSILKKKAQYNMIIGERSNGKTYAVLEYVVKQYFENKGTFAYVRRWHEDVIGRRANDVFSALIHDKVIEKYSKGFYSGVYYFSGKFYLCNYDEKTGKPIYNDSDVLGYTFALSENEHNKSISYPTITTIMFDEFLTKQTYFKDEFVLFMNTVSTIVRQRENVTIFMLGNTVNKYCPYFNEMGISNIDKMKQGTIDVYRYGDSKLKVAVEYCASLESQKSNNYYFAFNNPKLQMITSGVWELDMYPHLPIEYKPRQIVFTYFIVFNDVTYQCEIIQVDSGDMFTYIHLKTTPIKDVDKDLIYTLDYNYKLNYNRSILKPINKLQERILWFYKTDRVYYQDNNVGNAISNYLKECRL